MIVILSLTSSQKSPIIGVEIGLLFRSKYSTANNYNLYFKKIQISKATSSNSTFYTQRNQSS